MLRRADARMRSKKLRTEDGRQEDGSTNYDLRMKAKTLRTKKAFESQYGKEEAKRF